MMKKRLDNLELAVVELRKEMRIIRNIIYYLAGLLTVQLGINLPIF